MKPGSRWFASVAGVAGVAFCAALIGGCASMRQPRKWGNCAALGALLGAGAGAASGIVIGRYTREGGHQRTNEAKTLAGVGGAAAGAIIGGLIGHYYCDPIIPPPPPPPPPRKVAEVPPPPPPPPVKHHEKIVLRGVHFAFNKADIRPEDAAVLDEAASVLQAHPNVTINVNGYCDSIGSVPYNLRLSQRRADAVAQYLESKGIASSRLITQGFGKTDFVATNATAAGRAQNRRVELVPVQ